MGSVRIACVYCGGAHERAAEVRTCFESQHQPTSGGQAQRPAPTTPAQAFDCPSCGRTHDSRGAVNRCAKLRQESELAQREAHRRVQVAKAKAKAAQRSFGGKWESTSGSARRLRDGNGETERPVDIELHRRISRGKERYE